ncbi:isochorismate synthase [Filobacillus milosensis]|uniref:Isochorismate synthase MenF n=1 Tax=Filobacillus milosensis TaxID=94137 RepID=A0A4Y8IJN3_9BACI|nr:isochorismate synthase [Filobacillus milosensis]TFB13789.1 isochorismate synthase [Filobacillus milosensis]
MLKTKQLTINEQLNKVKDQLSDGEQKNVSVIEEINEINPVDFFAAFEATDMHRVFWKDVTENIYFVGIGAHEKFQTNTQDRFQSMKEQWDKYVQNVQVAIDAVKGTGPILLGGFSFNQNISSEKWKKFRPGMMVLPEMMLTVNEEGCYMTYNLSITSSTNVSRTVRELKRWKHQISGLNDNQDSQTVKSTKSLDYRNWNQLILDAVETIKSGKLGKVVLARELEAEFNQDINLKEVLKRLDEDETDSYIYIFDLGQDSFISVTPERLVSVRENELLSTCLAGTISRGETEEEDDVLAWSLLNDEKNLSEHQYVVNMIKEAIEPLTKSISIPDKPVIYPLRSLQHLYTPVKATMKETISIFDLIEKLHPTPALGGEPRELAMEFISSHEPFERGWYAAPIGWVDYQGNGEFAVAIRSALISKNEATLFAGCGIVEESDPEAEYEETKLKFTPMLEALGGVSR